MLEEFGKTDAVKMLEEEQKKIVKWVNYHPCSNRKQYLLRLYATCEFSIQALRREIEGGFTIAQMNRIEDLIEQERKKNGR